MNRDIQFYLFFRWFLSFEVELKNITKAFSRVFSDMVEMQIQQVGTLEGRLQGHSEHPCHGDDKQGDLHPGSHLLPSHMYFISTIVEAS